MIWSWIKYFLYFLGGCLLLIACGIYWLKGETEEGLGVIDRFGGSEVVSDRSIIPVGIDEIYMRSLRLKPEQDIVYDIRAFKPCAEYSQNCLIQDSAKINFDLISTGIVLREVDEFLIRRARVFLKVLVRWFMKLQRSLRGLRCCGA
ncbi:hypothetical protein [Pseudomonas sp. LB3P31]